MRQDSRTVGGLLSRFAPGLALVGVCGLLGWLVHAVVAVASPLVVSLAVGAVAANAGLVPRSALPGIEFASKRLLRIGVVLLGFELSFADVIRLGAPGLAIVIAVVSATFVGTLLVGRRLRVGNDLTLLVAAGFAICGASAVAAMKEATDADDDSAGYAIALVTLCGTLSVFLLPPLRQPLGLSAAEFGSWSGAAVHDVAQVVATASTAGAPALTAAVVVKLTRVLLLVPLVAAVSLRRSPAGGAGRRGPLIPGFVLGFLVAVVVQTTGVLPSGALHSISTVRTVLFVCALAAIGAGVQLRALARLGGRPLLLALASWAIVAAMAYGGVLLVG